MLSAIKFNNKYKEAYFESGKIYFKLKEYQKAILGFTNAMSNGLNNSEVYKYRANAYYENKKFKKNSRKNK